MIYIFSASIMSDGPGNASLIKICPVSRERWKREGFRPVIQNAYVMKLAAATCRVNCFRMRHNSVGPFMVLIIY